MVIIDCALTITFSGSPISLCAKRCVVKLKTTSYRVAHEIIHGTSNSSSAAFMASPSSSRVCSEVQKLRALALLKDHGEENEEAWERQRENREKNRESRGKESSSRDQEGLSRG